MSSGVVVRTDLGHGTAILVEARRAGAQEEDVSIRDLLSFEGVEESIVAVSNRVANAIQRVAPRSASVEFGIDVTLESGTLTGMLAKGSGAATLKVTLNWGGTDGT
jgi:Trypsin-co-occurring domain 1